MPEFTGGLDALDAQIQKKITQASASAITIEAHEEMAKKKRAAVDSFSKGNLTAKGFKQRYDRYTNKRGVFFVDTILELKRTLHLLTRNPTNVMRDLKHENDHMSKALQLGLKGRYRFELLKDPFGGIVYIPSAHIEFPMDLSDEEIRRLSLEIASAPEILSSSDKLHVPK